MEQELEQKLLDFMVRPNHNHATFCTDLIEIVRTHDGAAAKTKGLTAIEKMDALYNSEINVSISYMWDGGYDVKIGTEYSGFEDQDCCIYGFENAVNAAWDMAKKLYPQAQAFHNPNTKPWTEDMRRPAP